MIRKIIWALIIILLIAATAAYYFGQKIFTSNINPDIENSYLYIPEQSSFDDVVQLLNSHDILKNTESFRFVAGLMKYDRKKVPSGRFKIDPEWNNKELISHLRSGQQESIKLTFNNVRIPKELAGKVSEYIDVDSTELLTLMKDPKTLNKIGFDTFNLISFFIPNTYEFYWDTNEKEFLNRMEREYRKFWGEDRIAKAKKIGMSPQEVSTLASIVEKETIQKNEKATIAGVYLNRLKKGIMLQADPTVVFATGEFDLRRVLNKHLEMDSPYNTYKNQGLPPGPICMPSISSIDAVLNAENHDYIFFCAKPGYNGEHAFAKTLSGHNRNANVYRQWLKENNIR